MSRITAAMGSTSMAVVASCLTPATATLGNTHVANNAFTTNLGLRVAIDMRGGGKAQFGSIFGPNSSNVIENNANGGVSLQENAEISFWSLQSSGPNIIRNNGVRGRGGIRQSGHARRRSDHRPHRTSG